eukprot:Awhi_evm1s11735
MELMKREGFGILDFGPQALMSFLQDYECPFDLILVARKYQLEHSIKVIRRHCPPNWISTFFAKV